MPGPRAEVFFGQGLPAVGRVLKVAAALVRGQQVLRWAGVFWEQARVVSAPARLVGAWAV